MALGIARERTKQRDHAGICCALAQSQKHPQYIHLLHTGSHGDQPRDDTPDDFQRGQPPTWSHVGHDDLRGDEHDAVRNVEVGGKSTRSASAYSVPGKNRISDEDTQVQLVAPKPQVLFHAGHIGVVYVGLIQESATVNSRIPFN